MTMRIEYHCGVYFYFFFVHATMVARHDTIVDCGFNHNMKKSIFERKYTKRPTNICFHLHPLDETQI